MVKQTCPQQQAPSSLLWAISKAPALYTIMGIPALGLSNSSSMGTIVLEQYNIMATDFAENTLHTCVELYMYRCLLTVSGVVWPYNGYLL